MYLYYVVPLSWTYSWFFPYIDFETFWDADFRTQHSDSWLEREVTCELSKIERSEEEASGESEGGNT